jgi:hypothetical protein
MFTSPPLDPVISQANPVHVLKTWFFSLQVNTTSLLCYISTMYLGTGKGMIIKLVLVNLVIS